MEQPKETAHRLAWLARTNLPAALKEIELLAEKAAQFDRLQVQLSTPDPTI